MGTEKTGAVLMITEGALGQGATLIRGDRTPQPHPAVRIMGGGKSWTILPTLMAATHRVIAGKQEG